MKFLVSFIVFVSILSCGQGTPKQETVDISGIQRVSDSPIVYSKEVLKCSLPSSPISDVETYFFSDGEYSSESFELYNNYVTFPTLKSKGAHGFLASTNYNQKVESIIRVKVVEWYETPESRVISEVYTPGKPLSICLSEYNNKESLEAIAVSVVSQLETTYEKIREVYSKTIEPINLNIQSLHKKRLDYYNDGKLSFIRDMYTTDNQFYNLRDSSINTLPQSPEAIITGLFGGQKLWEIPAVNAHEYGHHFFYQLAPQIKTALFKKHSSGIHMKNCWLRDSAEDHSEYELNSIIKNSSDRDNDKFMAIKAINEGFADLMAYYTLGEKKRSLKGLGCFGEQRNIDDAFLSGFAKKFDAYMLNTYFSRIERKRTSRNCTSPDYQDPHMVGAIFAHRYNSLMEEFDINRADRLRFLIFWVEKLGKEFSNADSDGRAYFSYALSTLNSELISFFGISKDGLTSQQKYELEQFIL